jgi:hypothetical protein
MSVAAQAECQCSLPWPAVTERDCHVDPGARPRRTCWGPSGKRLPPGEDPDAVFGEGVIGHAARAGTREAPWALLRALAVLGVTPAQRDAAASAAAALAPIR